MKNKLRLIIGLGLIVVGLLFFLIPRISTMLLKNESEKAVLTLDTLNSSALQENAEKEAEYDFDLITSINVQNTLQSTILGSSQIIDAYKHDLIGQLIIEDLDVNLVLFNGINNDKLLVGVSTMKPGQVMGQGNYSISGHYTDRFGVLLNRLPDIKHGMIIKITDKHTIYEYRVYETALVPATSTHLIEDHIATQHGSPIISLMSCYYFDHPDERWFAFAELVDSYPYDSSSLSQ